MSDTSTDGDRSLDGGRTQHAPSRYTGLLGVHRGLLPLPVLCLNPSSSCNIDPRLRAPPVPQYKEKATQTD